MYHRQFYSVIMFLLVTTTLFRTIFMDYISVTKRTKPRRASTHAQVGPAEEDCQKRLVHMETLEQQQGDTEIELDLLKIHVFTSYPELQKAPSSFSKEEEFLLHDRHLNQWKVSVISAQQHGSVEIEAVISTKETRRMFLISHGRQCYGDSSNTAVMADENSVNIILTKFDDFSRLGLSQYSLELWKYCALSVYGGAFIQQDDTLLDYFWKLFPVFPAEDGSGFGGINYAIFGGDHLDTMHGSLLVMDSPMSPVALGMVKKLVETSSEEMDRFPLFLQKSLYGLICEDLDFDNCSSEFSLRPGWNEGNTSSLPSKKWVLLSQSCSTSLPQEDEDHLGSKSVQCEIIDPCTGSIMISRHTFLPLPSTPSHLPIPYLNQMNIDTSSTDSMDSKFIKEHPENMYISTIREVVFSKPSNFHDTPNFYHLLQNSGKLLTDEMSIRCLQRPQFRPYQGGSCTKCSHQPQCVTYCEVLCQDRAKDKFVSKHFIVNPPPFFKEENRLIPRIIHQTWAEPVIKKNYPNLSRIVNSWKRSGWEYRFYDDKASREFLKVHFPPEVLDAYDTVIPGAFRADLFRYCILFIHGGIYSDMDVMLESDLEIVIPEDVGFMIPFDTPGHEFGKRSCLWNGFIAAAPAHPFLANVIETVVNHIRNRFTSVDIDDYLCPKPVDFRLSQQFDYLYVTGPCILGASINQVLGRHLQENYETGELVSTTARITIPGRTVILSQNKDDMGGHRFTLVSKNLIVAATDLPDHGERVGKGTFHYSSTHQLGSIYGSTRVYKDMDIANEGIKIMVVNEE